KLMVWIHGITRLKKIFKIIGNPWKKNEIENEKNYLPRDILFLILSCLSMKDNIRASAVCKTWHDIAEYQGNIYLVDSVSSREQMRLIMFRLNRLRLSDIIFISNESSIMTYELPRDMSDIVYVWDSHINPDRPVKYSDMTAIELNLQTPTRCCIMLPGSSRHRTAVSMTSPL
ncbi:hypothetical protein HID58_033846, partial [Brassica napus]